MSIDNTNQQGIDLLKNVALFIANNILIYRSKVLVWHEADMILSLACDTETPIHLLQIMICITVRGQHLLLSNKHCTLLYSMFNIY